MSTTDICWKKQGKESKSEESGAGFFAVMRKKDDSLLSKSRSVDTPSFERLMVHKCCKCGKQMAGVKFIALRAVVASVIESWRQPVKGGNGFMERDYSCFRMDRGDGRK